MVTLYKVINKEYQSMNGGSFNWEKYLPKGDRKGKWTPREKGIDICSKGYHLTKHWNMWINSKDDIVYAAEAKNIKEWDYDKCVCESVRLIKRIDLYWLDNDNTGEYNTGHSNTGNWNTGDRNTGHRNTGDRNTGRSNTGDSNTGRSNTGHSNTGHRNTGDRNTGHSNTGNWNTGDRNTGHSNTGNWNTGDWNTGSFNTKNPDYYELFNKQISKEIYCNISWPDYFYFELNLDKSYQECFIGSFNKASREEIQKTIDLPNFDYKIFAEITGITKAMITKRLKKK